MDAKETFDGDIGQLLAWHLAMGADEAIGEEPINHFEAPKQETTAPSKAGAEAPAPKPPTAQHTTAAAKPSGSGPNIARGRPNAQHPQDSATAAATANKAVNECDSLDALKTVLESFAGCPLKRTATKTVFGAGNHNADIMIIADPPGEAEDRSGEPFSGDPGQLFNKMMAAINQTRDKDLYLANVIPWRPPGGRQPNDLELATAMPFIKRQISLVKPKVLLLMGDGAYKFLTNDKKPIAKARGKWTSITINDQTFEVLPTYHPRYLLQQPLLKKDSWHDLQLLMQKLSS